MTQQTSIKTLKGGSIDYAHYIAKSHEIRSNDAHQGLAKIWQMFRAAWAVTKSLILVRRPPDGAKAARFSLDRSAQKPPFLRIATYQGNSAGKPKAQSVPG